MTTESASSSASPAPPPRGVQVLDGAAIERVLKRIAHEIIERHADLERVALAGIPLRGIEISRRIADYLEEFAGVRPFAGVLDVSMHRDDLHTGRRLATVMATRLPPDLSTKTVILVDDVLFSGRTCRAAMDALSSFGRPPRIQLAVLIDRGHRELPIRADYVGKNIPTSSGERVYVRFAGVDDVPDSVWLERGGAS